MANIAFIMMGGSGTRMGGDIPKQYVEIEGHPVFWHIARAYLMAEPIQSICIVSKGEWIDFTNDAIKDLERIGKDIAVTKGGENRSESVRNALIAIKSKANSEDVIMIHDATHPYLDTKILQNLIDATNQYGGATVGMRQYDTCYGIDKNDILTRVIPRREVISGASPECFHYGDLCDIYFNADKTELEKMTSAGAIALAHNIPMKVISTDILNLKLTYPSDMELYRLLTNKYFFEQD